MQAYRLLGALLQYPEADLQAAVPDLRAVLEDLPPARACALAPLLDMLAGTALISLQERYVGLFDRNRSLSLHLFEHVYGESRERGPAMISLMQEYTDHGFVIASSELPDYLPLFLEFLGQLPEDEAAPLLGEAIHVIARIGEKLAELGSAYAGIFAVLGSMTDVTPLPLAEPPVRDMDEAMEVFGIGSDGTEPLLQPGHGTRTIQFYPRTARQGA